MRDTPERNKKRDNEINIRMIAAVVLAIVIGIILFLAFRGFF